MIVQPHFFWIYPTVMSNMLEPTELDTAISPRPFRATITLVIRSGMEVPAANMVRPIISSVTQNVSPTCKEKEGEKHIMLGSVFQDVKWTSVCVSGAVRMLVTAQTYY